MHDLRVSCHGHGVQLDPHAINLLRSLLILPLYAFLLKTRAHTDAVIYAVKAFTASPS
jgi:hypothetical protein